MGPILNVVFPIFAIMAAGYAAGHFRILGAASSEALNRFVYFIALATLQAERNAPGATITDFGLAIWWAIVTIATVGYGDTYPVTVVGRLYATGLMIGGIAIVGAASATMISFISDKIGVTLHRDIRDEDVDD